MENRSGSRSIQIVSHHKTGTVAAASLYFSLCGKTPTWRDRSHSRLQPSLKRSQIQDIAGSSPGGKLLTIQQVKATCGSRVVFSMNGWQRRLEARHDYVHMVRNPIETLVSGYLYHRSCAEDWTKERYTSRSKPGVRWPAAGFPSSLRFNGSFCRHLQNVSMSTGLETELYRTMHAADGIGNMLRLLPKLEQLNSISVCLQHLAATVPLLSQMLRHNISIIDAPQHHTAHNATTTQLARALWMRQASGSDESAALCNGATAMFRTWCPQQTGGSASAQNLSHCVRSRWTASALQRREIEETV